MSTFRIIHSDVLDGLRSLPDASVHCCVTSPPYWGLRDYGVVGQLGLERTPEEYVAAMVAVFREVRRVLRADGTCWINLGDSYVSGGGTGHQGKHGDRCNRTHTQRSILRDMPESSGLKAKNLCGIPWSVAKALQAPYYTGKIASERDRIWLAATVDAEGSICGFHHTRKDDGTVRTGIHIHITNTSMLMLDNAFRIWPTTRIDHNMHGEGHYGSADTHRWIAHDVDEKAQLLAEIYPYLIVKKQQALLAWNFLEMSRISKRIGKTQEGSDLKAKRSQIVHLLTSLNHFESVDIPNWCSEPSSMFEPGWYLRSDIIWHKPNPMPESVTDRPTKAHEYLFLLTKSERYAYDVDAIREPTIPDSRDNQWGKTETTRFNDHSADLERGMMQKKPDGFVHMSNPLGRNKRTVWTVCTEPYPEAHFAVMPTQLVEPCIMAGCPEGGTVLDPFAGSGTVGVVAMRHARDFIGIELNAEYVEMARRRIHDDMPMFNMEAVSVCNIG